MRLPASSSTNTKNYSVTLLHRERHLLKLVLISSVEFCNFCVKRSHVGRIMFLQAFQRQIRELQKYSTTLDSVLSWVALYTPWNADRYVKYSSALPGKVQVLTNGAWQKGHNLSCTLLLYSNDILPWTGVQNSLRCGA